MDQAERKTPLYNRHVALKGKMVPCAGYLLPVQYTGVIEEHLAVRNAAGVFDVSHMGELIVSGPNALLNINNLLTNDFTKMADYRVRYSPMCNDSGGVIDDLLVYRYSEDKYLLVLNAANREKDINWIRAHLTGDVSAHDISDETSELALQGPNARAILEKLVENKDDIPQKYYSFTPSLLVAGINCIVSRTGYTGEHGYELYCKNEEAESLLDAVLHAGKEHGLLPCGLGARDTLRLEASMPLYGHEMDETISPLETGLSFAVKLDKETFIGKDGMLNRGAPKIARVGMRMTSRGIARDGSAVFHDGKQIGAVTSGTHLPYLGVAYAMALVNSDCTEIGTELTVDVRGRTVTAEIVPLPFYKLDK